MVIINDQDKAILRELQGDLPLEPRPFAKIASRVGVSEEYLMQRINAMMDEGIIRRFAAILRHQKAGYTVNAMVAWKVEPEQVDKMGIKFAACEQVSHCYLREVPADFDKNLFTMVHCRSKEELNQLVINMSELLGLKDYAIISSEHEYKKISMKYF